MHLLITGGFGFIGSHFVRLALQKFDVETVLNVDAVTYAGSQENVAECERNPKYGFVRCDLRDYGKLASIIRSHPVTHVVHLAAETHVDRSINDPDSFIKTNIIGTYNLLRAIRKTKKLEKFVYVSTDEVYGSVTEPATEEDTLRPSSPYSASKAAAEMIVMAEGKTFGLPWCITRGTNTYGTHQYPEKLLPVVVRAVMQGKPIPIYGNGLNVRDWMHVDDHCSGIWEVLTRGNIGEVWNIGANCPMSNINFVSNVLQCISKLGGPEGELAFVPDRLGHDQRYAVSAEKIEQRLFWHPVIHLSTLLQTVQWYMDKFKP